MDQHFIASMKTLAETLNEVKFQRYSSDLNIKKKVTSSLWSKDSHLLL